VADTLSWEITVSYVTTDVLPKIVASWHQNPSLVYLTGKLLSGEAVGSKYTWEDYHLHRKGKSVVGNDLQLQTR
jgi:hypothetical protein